MQKRMTYLGSMQAFEMGAQVSEYTRPEPGNEDHCVRADDHYFTVEKNGAVRSVVGSTLAALGLVRTRPEYWSAGYWPLALRGRYRLNQSI